jgi:hypothetical protein
LLVNIQCIYIYAYAYMNYSHHKAILC